MFFFGVATVLANWAMTYFFMMAGRWSDLPGTLRMMFRPRR